MGRTCTGVHAGKQRVLAHVDLGAQDVVLGGVFVAALVLRDAHGLQERRRQQARSHRLQQHENWWLVPRHLQLPALFGMLLAHYTARHSYAACML